MSPAESRPTGQPGAVAGREWVRQAIASCYFHSPMSRLASRLRDHYNLTISSNGRWPRLKKRQQPSARILYYHRVNNDNDPFFPAISTALFEAEMRFVSRHYRVVSLAELLRRLAGDATEPVLAITFDDGYRDNYENAFPILQRYGMPAAIFLTTGSMDTGEPLWFEQLAAAVKKTSREFIDLETIPTQRVWLRTSAERLDGNAQIFSALRPLSDPDRRWLLADVLRRLAVTDDRERHRKMFPWDAVRLMSKHRITFGGHTVNHPFLSRLSADDFRWEVSECKRRIEDEVQLPADYFAYPNGREEDFGQRQQGIDPGSRVSRCRNYDLGVNDSSTDPFELRRGGPWEENPAMFAYKLDWYELVEG